MRHNYARLFEPPLLPNRLSNPRHLSNAACLALARAESRRRPQRTGHWRGGAFPERGLPADARDVEVRGEVTVLECPEAPSTLALEIRA
jgi:hypothetical protein